MAFCKPCRTAADYKQANPETSWEEIQAMHCNQEDCACQHQQVERTPDGYYAPIGVRKDVR